MILYMLRGGFLILITAVTVLYVLTFQLEGSVQLPYILSIVLATLFFAGFVIAIDILTPRKKLSAISGVFLGLVAGLLAAYALSFVVDLIGVLVAPVLQNSQYPDRVIAFLNLLEGVKVLIGLLTCYIAISLVLQTKDDFRFVIPYVEFAKQIRGTRPTLLDTSIIIDGRIIELIKTNILQGGIIIPRFVLDELQAVADSADKLKRARGRRGLEILHALQNNEKATVTIDESDIQAPGVDQKLILLAQQLPARLMTTDFNLAQIAQVRNVDIINLNDLTSAMRPVALPGEILSIQLVKPGESQSQAVGYLDDGTMVVVEDGKNQIGKTVEFTVTSAIQTSAGRMIFGRLDPSPTNQSNQHPPSSSNKSHRNPRRPA